MLTQSNDFIEQWFAGLREVFTNNFVDKHLDINAEILLQKIKTKEVDGKKLTTIIKNLSEDTWSSKYVLETLKQFDDIVGISDTYLQKHTVNILSEKELLELRWKLVVKLMVDYGKSAKEIYDLLKYSTNPNLSHEQHKLMITLMDALNQINKAANNLFDRYNNVKLSKKTMTKFFSQRMAMDIFY